MEDAPSSKRKCIQIYAYIEINIYDYKHVHARISPHTNEYERDMYIYLLIKSRRIFNVAAEAKYRRAW